MMRRRVETLFRVSVIYSLLMLSLLYIIYESYFAKRQNTLLTPSKGSIMNDDAEIRTHLDIKPISDSHSSERSESVSSRNFGKEDGKTRNRETQWLSSSEKEDYSQMDIVLTELEKEKRTSNGVIKELNGTLVAGEMIVISVGCKDYRRHWREVMGNLTRQKMQLFTLIKSIVIFSTRPTHFILVTDSQDTYDQLVDFVFHSKHPDYQPHWPDEYRKKIKLSRRQVIYPPAMEKIKYMYAACTTSKLFLGSMFPDIDAAIVVDTDFLFLRPLDDLWNQFNNFTKKQIYGFAPSHIYYASHRNKLPYCGATGINAGLIMVNFTRMKAVAKPIIDNFEQLYETNKNRLKFAEQDLFNIFCAQDPELFYDVPCDWNTQLAFCSLHGEYRCVEGRRGISAFHATGGRAINAEDYKVSAMFNALRTIQLTKKDLKELPHILLKYFYDIDTRKLPDHCANISLYNIMVTKHMIDFFYR